MNISVKNKKIDKKPSLFLLINHPFSVKIDTMIDENLKLLQNNWQEMLLSIKDENNLTNVAYSTWLAPLEAHAVEDDILFILYSKDTDQMTIDHIKRKFENFLIVAIAEITGKEYRLQFLLPKDAKKREEAQSEKEQDAQVNASIIEQSNLNTKYTFDSFVVGNNNRFAQTASLAVAESPGEAYNPLYIYGGPGLGKTHLMHAIGNYILQNDSTMKVLYVTSEEFTNEVIEAIRSTNNTTTMTKFREKYRKVNVLMIDDIQFIVGKDATQEEFFHTFNTLHAQGKQIILTSDQPPKDMTTLEERIRTRFEMGLMADIGQPDYETRMAIIRRKVEAENVHFDDEILKYIADNIKSNIREIEGALNKLIAYETLQQTHVTLEIAEKELQNIISPDKPKAITAQLIIETVAEHYQISMDQIISKNRSNQIARPRQIAMYLCREMIDTPLDAIGALLGGRDHSTIIHGHKRIVDEYTNNEGLRKEIDIIKKKIKP